MNTLAFNNHVAETGIRLATELDEIRTALHVELVKIFGAEPKQVLLTNRGHLSITADMRGLCLVAGGEWSAIVHRIDELTAEAKTRKAAGPDVRFREEPRAQGG